MNTFYTRGKGFYENYASGYGFGINFADLGLDNIITDGGDTITSTHIVKRRWLDNDFYGFSTSYTHSGIEHLDLIAGGDIIDTAADTLAPYLGCNMPVQQVLTTCIMMEVA